MNLDTIVRVSDKIAFAGPDECWLWTGTVHKKTGYGVLGHEYAHRVVYEIAVGPIPEGLHIDHVRKRGCVHRHCVNWHHLEPVTLAENNRRAGETKTHCPHGHEYDETNTYRRPSGARVCRACRREGMRLAS